MQWRAIYLDLILIPLSILISLVYLWLLRYKSRTTQLQTVTGLDSACRRIWVLARIKDSDGQSILASQSIHNTIIGSTLMASTSILLFTGLVAVMMSNYSIEPPVADSIYSTQGKQFTVFKYMCVLFILLLAVICYSFSIWFINQVRLNITSPAGTGLLSPDCICDIMEKGFVFDTLGNRLLYVGLPLLLWIFGPVLVFISSVAVVTIQYMTDIDF